MKQVAINEPGIQALEKLGFKLGKHEVDNEGFQFWNSSNFIKAQEDLEYRDKLIDTQIENGMKVMDEIKELQ